MKARNALPIADHTEIEGNDLARATMSTIDRIRPHLTTISAAIGLLVAGLAAWTLFSSQRVAEKEQAWNSCLAAVTSGDAAALLDVANRHAGSPAGTWARLLLADGALADGNRRAFVDKQRGREQFQAAVEGYSAVLASKPGSLAAERAAFGLAKAREALGQIDLARQGYETVAKEHADGPLRDLAAQRATALGLPAAPAWYSWFDSVDVAPAPSTPPATGGAAELLMPGSGG